MRAREAAVRPVSLILKKADIAIRKMMAAICIPMDMDIFLADRRER
jgi:hypothetical protein